LLFHVNDTFDVYHFLSETSPIGIRNEWLRRLKIQCLRRENLAKAALTIDVKQAEAFYDEDRKMILQLINKEVGFKNMNDIIKQKLLREAHEDGFWARWKYIYREHIPILGYLDINEHYDIWLRSIKKVGYMVIYEPLKCLLEVCVPPDELQLVTSFLQST